MRGAFLLLFTIAVSQGMVEGYTLVLCNGEEINRNCPTLNCNNGNQSDDLINICKHFQQICQNSETCNLQASRSQGKIAKTGAAREPPESNKGQTITLIVFVSLAGTGCVVLAVTIFLMRSRYQTKRRVQRRNTDKLTTLASPLSPRTNSFPQTSHVNEGYVPDLPSPSHEELRNSPDNAYEDMRITSATANSANTDTIYENGLITSGAANSANTDTVYENESMKSAEAVNPLNKNTVYESESMTSARANPGNRSTVYENIGHRIPTPPESVHSSQQDSGSEGDASWDSASSDGVSQGDDSEASQSGDSTSARFKEVEMRKNPGRPGRASKKETQHEETIYDQPWDWKMPS